MHPTKLHEQAAAILSALEEQQRRARSGEHRYGVDAFLRAQELFQKLPPDTPPEKLKFLLAPLFCQTDADQDAFYALADQCWREIEEKHREAEAAREAGPDLPPTPLPAWKRYAPWLVGVLILLLAGAGIWLWLEPKPPAPSRQLPEALYHDVQAPAGQTVDLCIDTIQLKKYRRWKLEGFCDGMPENRITAHGQFSGLDKIPFRKAGEACMSLITYTAFDTSGVDSVCISLSTPDGLLRCVWRLYLSPPPTTTTADRQTSTVDRWPSKIRPDPPPLDDLRVQPLEGHLAWIAQYADWLRAAFILLLGALLALLLYALEQRRKKPVATPEAAGKPPYVWNIAFDDRPEPEAGDTFQKILNRLRRRVGEDVWTLDLPASVQATIARAGMPEFRFRQRTRPPEYLLLIDRRSPANHRARLFESLYQAFRANDVLVERYFFDGELQVVFNETHPQGLRLSELQHRHPYHRLLVMSDGFSLLSPTTGQPALWTAMLSRWRERALLTPQPTAEFGRRERTLGALFPAVLPASLQSLNFLIEELDAEPGEARFHRWRERVADAIREPLELRGPLVPALRNYYSEHELRWIAACAVYPNLYWDLTLWWYGRAAVGPARSVDPTPDPSPRGEGSRDVHRRVHRLLFAISKLKRSTLRLPSPLGEGSGVGSTPGKELGGACLPAGRGPTPREAPEADPPTLTTTQILNLARLPWFVEGRIPQEQRAELVAWLESLDGGAYLRGLRQQLHDFLQAQTPPPEGSAAAEAWQMHLALNEWRSTANRKRRRELEAEIAQRLEAGAEADFTMIRYLDKPGPLDFVVPRRWRRWVHPAGMRGLGWRPRAKETLVAALLWLGLSAGAIFWPAPQEPCPGDRVVYREQTYCIQEREDHIRLNEYLIRDALAEARLDPADSLYNESLEWAYNLEYPGEAYAARLDSMLQATARRNAIDYYLRGLEYLQTPADTLPGSPARDTACRCFAKAFELDTVDLDLRRAAFWCRGEQDTAKTRYNIAAELPGLVTDSAGAPLAGARVLALEAGLRMTTDDRGRYTLRLPVETYPRPDVTLQVSLAGYEPLSRTVTVDGAIELPSLALRKPRGSARTTARLRAIVLAGRVLDEASGQPIANAEIRSPYDTARTDSRGRYRYNLPPDSTYPEGISLQFYAPGGYKTAIHLARMAELQPGQAAPVDSLTVRLGKGTTPAPGKGNDTTALVRAAELERLFVLIRVEGDSFTMGCKAAERDGDCYDDERPPHQVTVGDFWIGKYEVTQAQWRAVMGENPPDLYNKGCDQCPVDRVSWNDVQEFLKRLNASTGKNYRLPTEAEWEFAARGGRRSNGYLYSGSHDINQVAWYNGNHKTNNSFGEQKTTRPVGTRKGNELEIHDMSGNVWEWVEDDWHSNHKGAPTDGRAWIDGINRGSFRVYRGGSWGGGPRFCRAAYRYRGESTGRSRSVGFRLAL